jgi:DNA-binding transcriptional ArsR family regulator
MTSHSEPEIEIKRQWSVIPVRALLDRKLHQSHFRVLVALCVFTNSHGVCWPGVKTIGAMLGVDPASVSRAITKLVKAGYVRKLRPQDYQMEHAKFGKINRYQVLYQPDMPLPSWEEVQSSQLLSPASDAPDAHMNDIGGTGGHDALLSLSHSLAHAYSHAIERALGQSRRPENELGAARMLAAQGVTVSQVIEATEAHAKACLARRAGVPALADVARAMS